MKVKDLVGTGHPGRPPKNAKVWLDRQRPAFTAKWARSLRRALKFLNDPATPIDGTWVRLFNSVADRIGYHRTSEQTVAATVTSTSVTVNYESVLYQIEERRRILLERFGPDGAMEFRQLEERAVVADALGLLGEGKLDG